MNRSITEWQKAKRLEEHAHQSEIRGHPEHKDIWNPYTGKHVMLQH